MKKAILIACLCAFAFAHPHIFADSKVTVVLDKNGIERIEEEWLFDDMTSVGMIDDFDKNRNKKFEDTEIKAMKPIAFDQTKPYQYYTYITINGKKIALQNISAFTARIEKNRVRYIFYPLVKIPLAAKNTLSLSLLDKEYYVAFMFEQKDIKIVNNGGWKVKTSTSSASNLSYDSVTLNMQIDR